MDWLTERHVSHFPHSHCMGRRRCRGLRLWMGVANGVSRAGCCGIMIGPAVREPARKSLSSPLPPVPNLEEVLAAPASARPGIVARYLRIAGVAELKDSSDFTNSESFHRPRSAGSAASQRRTRAGSDSATYLQTSSISSRTLLFFSAHAQAASGSLTHQYRTAPP